MVKSVFINMDCSIAILRNAQWLFGILNCFFFQICKINAVHINVKISLAKYFSKLYNHSHFRGALLQITFTILQLKIFHLFYEFVFNKVVSIKILVSWALTYLASKTERTLTYHLAESDLPILLMSWGLESRSSMPKTV